MSRKVTGQGSIDGHHPLHRPRRITSATGICLVEYVAPEFDRALLIEVMNGTPDIVILQSIVEYDHSSLGQIRHPLATIGQDGVITVPSVHKEQPSNAI
jgi:hypothetical protein